MAGLAVRRRTARAYADPAGIIAGPRSRVGQRRWPTPSRVAAGAAAAVLLACCLAALTAFGAARLAGAFETIGQRYAPEVSATTGLYFALNDMDAQVANLLLVGREPDLAADRSHDLAAYDSDQATADADLQQATVTEGSHPAPLARLRTVLDRLGQYQALAGDALLADALLSGQGASGGRGPAGTAPSAATGYYRQATDLMRTGILPAVSALTTVSAESLDSAYQAGHSTAVTSSAAVAGAGAALIAALAAFQVYLARRYRRVLNPALAAATVAAVVFTGVACDRLGNASGQLTVAKQDAFDSILALTEARAVGYDANADESRYLVDPARAAQYQQGFLRKSQQLAAVGRVGIAGYDAALAADVNAYRRDIADVRFGGYLGAEFRNITFPGERAAAVATLLAYQRYERDDRTLRALAKEDRPAAVAFDVGPGAGQSDGAFNAYDAALGSVIAINQRAFGAALQSGQGAVGGWALGFPAAAAALLAVLTLAAVRPRLAEYRPAPGH